MVPIEAYINNRFSGTSDSVESGIFIQSKPKYYIHWSGDNSLENKVTISRLDEEKNVLIPVAEASLKKPGDKFSTNITILKKNNLLISSYYPKELDLCILRT